MPVPISAQQNVYWLYSNMIKLKRDESLAARDAIRADRDAHTAKYEDLDKRNYEETTRLRHKAKGFSDAMVEMDNILSGKLLLLPSAFAECPLLLSAFSHF